jgi:transposase
MDMIAENYIGCDVSKQTLDVFDEKSARHRRIANEAAAISAYVAGLDPARDFVVMEATGVYDRLLRHALAKAGVGFSRHNPQHTHFYTKSSRQRAKTDRLDAAMLAGYGRRYQPAADPAPCDETERLQSLARRRDQLVEIRAKQKTMLFQAFDADVAADIAGLIASLDARIAAIEALIKAAIGQAREPAGTYRLLVSAPGVAAVTALTLMAHMPELGHRSPKSIAALAGLAPINQDSGKASRRRPIRGGRPRVRRALYMAALGAIRANRKFRDAFTAIASRSGSKKLAIVAVARKLLVSLNAMIREQKAFV